VTNAREVAQLTETLKQKGQTKALRVRRYEKRENQYSQNKIFKEEGNDFIFVKSSQLELPWK
jgi:hypothetical protein